ncbi:hypothetical protein E2320_007121 [Naja naja]|nr:hypothetical protein E2320_007121 [Naja naja]
MGHKQTRESACVAARGTRSPPLRGGPPPFLTFPLPSARRSRDGGGPAGAELKSRDGAPEREKLGLALVDRPANLPPLASPALGPPGAGKGGPRQEQVHFEYLSQQVYK